MKKITNLPLLSLVLLGLVLVAAPGAQAQSAPALPGFGNNASTDELKTTPYEKRMEFVANVRNITTKLDARISGLTARAAAESASKPALAKSVEEVKAARAELESELSRINQAKAENWESARDGVLERLNRAQSAYDLAAKS